MRLLLQKDYSFGKAKKLRVNKKAVKLSSENDKYLFIAIGYRVCLPKGKRKRVPNRIP